MFSQEQYDALQQRAGLVDSSSRGRLLLTGPDRRDYLQGILTNDIAALNAGDGCYAALLTPQGRMISDLRVSELGDAVLIDLPGSTADTVRHRLADFIFSEDVEVHDQTAARTQIGLYGPQASEVLAQAIQAASPGGPEATGTLQDRLQRMAMSSNATLAFGGVPVIAVRSDDFGPGFELFVDGARAGELAAALRTAGAQDIGAPTAEIVRIEVGRPEFGVDMDEHTIPLEAGIEDRAISLTKGCYVGQEIIIRVLHRGQGRVAKRLVGFAADADGRDIARGEPVQAGGREIGVVTSAARSPKLRRPIALGYVQRDFTGPGTRVQIGGGADVLDAAVVSLPFAPREGG